MTEKRFTIADGFKIVAIKDNDKIMNSRQVCNKLNELNNENKELEDKCEVMEKVLENKGFDVVYDIGKGKWVIE